MEESEGNMSVESVEKLEIQPAVKKPKKRSLVERELETSLTARVTLPATIGDGLSTSRYGRSRRLRTQSELMESQKMMLASINSPGNEKTPVRVNSPVYRMHASNSPHKSETPKNVSETNIDSQIDNIYQENISLSRFSDDNGSPSPAKKFPKVYIRKDLIQKREAEESIMLIKNLFSPTESAMKSTNSPMSISSEHSSEKYNSKQNGHVDNTSVVKTLDFDGNKKRKYQNRERKPALSKNELFELEAKCPYKVGDLAWARMGTFPFWPCIVTRDPYSEMFIKKKMFGRVEHQIVHVTFFGDNGRRSWVVDNMLRSYLGQLEFEATRERFTQEDKKKDPKLYAAYFVSEKKQTLWNNSVEEAEILWREPKRLRVDLFNDMLLKSRASKKTQKSGRISRTNSDVSLSESLYDSLFSEDDVKTDDAERSKNKSRNKSFDVSEVVTACLDNMAAKTGITKIQRQSHMDRWLQKAKSKTPEKTQPKPPVVLPKVEKVEKTRGKSSGIPIKVEKKVSIKNKKRPTLPPQKPYRFRRIHGSQSKQTQNVSDQTEDCVMIDDSPGLGFISKIESLADTDEEINQNTKTTIIPIDYEPVKIKSEVTDIEEIKQNTLTTTTPVNGESSDAIVHPTEQPPKENSSHGGKNYTGNTSKDSIMEVDVATKSSVKPAQTNGKITDFDNGNKDSIKVVDEDTINDSAQANIEKSVFDKIIPQNSDNLVQVIGERSNDYEVCTDSAIEVDADKDIKTQKNEEKSKLMSQTVSNKSVEDNELQLTDDNDIININDTIKEAQNVTIEASVTEPKNDDTLNSQAEEGHQESNDMQKPSKNPETNVDDIIFLDESNSQIENMAETSPKSGSKNTSTSEKLKICVKVTSKDEKSTDVSSQEVELEKEVLNLNQTQNLHKSENNYINQKNNFSKSAFESISIKNIMSIDESVYNVEDFLNKSGNSELKLQLNKIDGQGNKKHCEPTVNKTFNDTNKSKSIFGSNQINEITDKNKLGFESTIEKFENGSKSKKTEEEEEESHESLSRQYVESPTFTQLLESEEFFLDVTCDNVHNQNKEINQTVFEKSESLKEVEHISKSIEDNKTVAQYIDEDFDDEDISDDEPSPEYESLDEDITEDFRKHMMSIEKNITDKKDEEQIVKICNEIAEKAKLSPTKYSVDMNVAKPTDKLNIRPTDQDETSMEKLKKCESSDKVSTKHQEQSLVDKQKINQIKTNNIPKKLDLDNIHNKDIGLTINGDATVKEITDETKKMYRTRVSLNSLTKERANSDISCEYEPTVVIIPLKIDKTENSKVKENKAKLLIEDKSKKKHTRSRLSLKRDSPKSRYTERKTIENVEPVIQFLESKEIKSELLVKEEETVTMNKPPTKVNIENGAIETKIPEATMVNGCHHNEDRKCTDAVDFIDDTDFDIDTVSFNSEDSEISSTNSIECTPRRNLRSRPERTLENALKNIEFLKYLELRQDYLMDLHPELNADEVVSYVYKTWQYEEDVKSAIKNDEARHSNLVKSHKQETSSRKKSRNSQPKNNIENIFREKYEKCRKTIDLESEKFDSRLQSSKTTTEDVRVKRKTRSISPDLVNATSESSNDLSLVQDMYTNMDNISIKSEESLTPKRTLRSKAMTPKTLEKQINDIENKSTSDRKVKKEREFDTESVGSEDSEVPLRQLRSKIMKERKSPLEMKVDLISESNTSAIEAEVKEEPDETASTVSDNEPIVKQMKKNTDKKSVEDPEFIKFLELRRDALMDENPQLTQNEIVSYLHKTWLYEENSKSDLKKNDELEQANLVKGLKNTEVSPPKKVRRKPKVEKSVEDEVTPRVKPRRRTIQPYYNENYSDIEEELQVFEIFRTKKSPITVVSKAEKDKIKSPSAKSGKEVESLKLTLKTEDIDKNEDANLELMEEIEEVNTESQWIDEIELYFTELAKPKPSVFKGLIREKVCDICELAGNLVKCKGCNGAFHADCVKRETGVIEIDDVVPTRGRKKKSKLSTRGRKPKNLEDSGSHSDEKSQDISVESLAEDIMPPEIGTFDADSFEAQLAAKMKELLDSVNNETNYDSYSSDDGIDWKDTVAGKCEIVEVKLKRRSPPIDYSNFKCNNCQIHDVPVCFVCKLAVSKTAVKMRQKCHVPHCHKYYHLECLDHWPQTQFNSGGPSRNNKKISEFFEALACPRHVCHTCVSDDPRGCKTRFSGDKLAKCVRCPATYHSFNKCLPAGSQILTASHIICPRHTDNRPGKVPCHVNTGWCFICAQGGSLICCEYCPTSFHSECLNIKPPEGNYMCEDCETGRLPLYGEMMWVKLGHYRWWPGIVLHPSEIPDNIMAVKHGQGEFVVRFFGQYDHYWVNRGRVFPYQEGDSGRISGQKSKIDAAFTTAIEHAQRAYKILKNAAPNEEESLDIASSLLPPHFVKLKCNKPCGSLCGRKLEDPSLSLTQCECDPAQRQPCGPYSQCLNRMLLTECGPTCRAGERCNNRAFEKRLYPKLEPYRAPHRGWGLRTTEDIKAGQFVIEYVGELIDEEEFKRRMRRKHEIRDENYYFLTLDKERMIDAGPKGNLARFMNHCCEPNCETQKWTVLGDIRVGLFAIDDIPANREVTFNYNLECAGIDKKRCLCGAKRCSGYIGAKPKQDESHSKKSKDGKLAAKRTYKKRKPDESPSNIKLKPKKPVGRPPKPKELTEIEKDLLIIKNATNMSSNESSRNQSIDDKAPMSLKRKRVSISTEEVPICNGEEPCLKKPKCEDNSSEVGD